MPETDPRIDAYIAKAEPFAQPVLKHLRQIIHAACPAVEETMKWGMPYFVYKGEILCSFASFKKHCVFGFWKASLMADPQNLFDVNAAMGQFGKITGLRDLPPSGVLKSYIKEAMKLNDDGVKLKDRTKAAVGKNKPVVPDYFAKALAANKAAGKIFEALTQPHKKEYLDWITEARTEPTRQKRVAAAIEQIAKGKQRNAK